ncbi:hypothetical protein AB0L82_22115 [Nocardia sp. NPDC052001]|uniref:hypothetical protein n=1 Tax=Nocardia sp. NPDC052001 TaxID=3154853 RepID=UPI00341475C2
MDERTPAQHKADIAACTLNRLSRIDGELYWLVSQFRALSRWAEENPVLGVDAADLKEMAQAARSLRDCGPERVRDLAVTLPIRGLEFGYEGA